MASEGRGQNELFAWEGAERPPKVSPEQMQWIASAVRNHTPNQLRFEFGLWTFRLIGQLIERQFGMTLSLPTLGKIMAQLGFTTQRPLYRPGQQDATLVQRWLSEDLPALRARAKAKGAKLLFADEASMRRHCHAGITCAPRGYTPIVAADGLLSNVNMISAISSAAQKPRVIVGLRSTQSGGKVIPI